MNARTRFALISVFMIFALSGCLTTRAQLKNDGATDEGKPVPAKVVDVQPQGQYVIDEIKSELTRLNGRIEDLERAQKQAADANAGAGREDVKKLDGRIVELEQAQVAMLEALKKLQETGAVSADPTELFERGKQQFEAKNYDGAIETLSAYLKAPKAKTFAERATFLRAESYFALKQYKKAIVDYSKFPEKFTSSKHMPAALQKIGLAFEALGMKEDARGFYQELVDKFPKSPEAKSARSKLR